MVNFIRPAKGGLYGIRMYECIPADLCDRVMGYFDAQPKDRKSELLYGQKRSFEDLILDDATMQRHPPLRRVYRRVQKNMHVYIDEHVALPELREQIKRGCYSLQPRMKKYIPGSEFPLHSDDSSLLALTRRFAYILYLNDRFKGGETIFKSGTDELAKIQPIQGSLLVFPIHPTLMHQGLLVEEGYKYILNGFACVLTSQARAVTLTGKPPSRLGLVLEEVRMLNTQLNAAAHQVFSENK